MDASDEELLDVVVRSLASNRTPISRAARSLPNCPGLYAIHASPEVWTELGLDQRPTDVPLYVGKAEDSLVTRDLKTHFAVDPSVAPRTGSSTLRRSFAALLREQLDLRAVPRNKSNPGYFSNFGLEIDGDRRLTRWMQTNLTLSCWPKPPGLKADLAVLEKEVVGLWDPPINLQNSPTRLPRLLDARAVMAAQARTWATDNGL